MLIANNLDSTESHSLHKECSIQQMLHLMVSQLTQLMLLPLNSLAEVFHKSGGREGWVDIVITLQALADLYQLFILKLF